FHPAWNRPPLRACSRIEQSQRAVQSSQLGASGGQDCRGIVVCFDQQMPKRDWPHQRSCVWVVGLRHRLSAYAADRHITDNADYAKGSSSVAIGLAYRVLIGPESLRHDAIDDGNGTQLSGYAL